MPDITFEFLEGDIPEYQFQVEPQTPTFEFELGTRGATGAQGPQGEPGEPGTPGTTLPSQTGNAGKFLTTDGTDLSWAVNLAERVGATIVVESGGEIDIEAAFTADPAATFVAIITTPAPGAIFIRLPGEAVSPRFTLIVSSLGAGSGDPVSDYATYTFTSPTGSVVESMPPNTSELGIVYDCFPSPSRWGLTAQNHLLLLGPSTATNNAIALFDGTDGELLKDSAVVLSTDGALTSNSDNKVPTEKAVKTYADLMIPKSTGTTKGDLLIYTASGTVTRKGVAAEGKTLVANSNETTGWGYAGMSAPVIFESAAMSALAPYIATNAALTSGRIIYYRFRVPRRITFDRFYINHVSGVSTTGSIYLGIYACTAVGGGPGTLIHDLTSGGAINPTTAAAIKSVSGTWALDPDDYWYAVLSVFTGTAPTVAFATVVGSYIFPDATGAGNLTPFQNGVSALPSPTAAGYSVGVNSVPVMLARPS